MNIKITNKDVAWSFFAQILTMGIGLIILPVLLKTLSSGELGIWYIFQSFMFVANVLDFGFQPVFIRNVSYLYSGATNLLQTGLTQDCHGEPNYKLLKVLIRDMRYFYLAITILFLIILLLVGHFYIRFVLEKGGLSDAKMLYWWIYAVGLSLNLYFSYYTCLLQGRGFVKYANWATITSKILFALIAVILLFAGYGLFSLVAGHLISCIINRYLFSYFNRKGPFLYFIHKEKIQKGLSLFKIIYHNAYKQGIGSVGFFIKTQGLLLITSYFFSLEDTASYGITVQILGVITTMSTLYFKTYASHFAQLCVLNKQHDVRNLFAQSEFVFIVVFIFSGLGVILFGNIILQFIGSQTLLFVFPVLSLMVLTEFIEANYAMASSFIAINNKVPFYKSSFITSFFVILLAVVFVKYFHWGCIGLVFAHFIANLIYNSWKWPYEVSQMLQTNYVKLFYEGYLYFKDKCKNYVILRMI